MKQHVLTFVAYLNSCLALCDVNVQYTRTFSGRKWRVHRKCICVARIFCTTLVQITASNSARFSASILVVFMVKHVEIPNVSSWKSFLSTVTESRKNTSYSRRTGPRPRKPSRAFRSVRPLLYATS